MTCEPVRVGVIGLGRAFMLTAPAFISDPRVKLVAACAPRQDSLSAFKHHFGGNTYRGLTEFCADTEVEAVYVATPHQMHAEHTLAAAASRKHVLVDKPISISMDDARKMVDACKRASVHLIVGPSHSFDGPVLLARKIIESGEFGRVRMINAFNYTDFIYRPRRPEELITEQGGGVIFSQAVHQIDVIRLLAGGNVVQINAMTGIWDAERSAEGAYSALLGFDTGAFASLTYSGYGYFDSDEWMNGINELGYEKDQGQYGRARKALKTALTPEQEVQLKQKRTLAMDSVFQHPKHHEHFGPVIVSCERGDLRLTPDGVWIYGEGERRFEPAPELSDPRSTVIDALVAAVRDGRPALQSGKWGMASLEVCHALLKSATENCVVRLNIKEKTKMMSWEKFDGRS